MAPNTVQQVPKSETSYAKFKYQQWNRKRLRDVSHEATSSSLCKVLKIEPKSPIIDVNEFVDICRRAKRFIKSMGLIQDQKAVCIIKTALSKTTLEYGYQGILDDFRDRHFSITSLINTLISKQNEIQMNQIYVEKRLTLLDQYTQNSEQSLRQLKGTVVNQKSTDRAQQNRRSKSIRIDSESKIDTKIRHIITEIKTTESNYKNNLQTLVTFLDDQLRHNVSLSQNEYRLIRSLTNVLKPLIDDSAALSHLLDRYMGSRQLNHHMLKVANGFSKLSRSMAIYGLFYSQNQVQFQHLFGNKTLSSSSGQLSIPDILVMPVQRGPRYGLLFKELNQAIDQKVTEMAKQMVSKHLASLGLEVSTVDLAYLEASVKERINPYATFMTEELLRQASLLNDLTNRYI